MRKTLNKDCGCGSSFFFSLHLPLLPSPFFPFPSFSFSPLFNFFMFLPISFLFLLLFVFSSFPTYLSSPQSSTFSSSQALSFPSLIPFILILSSPSSFISISCCCYFNFLVILFSNSSLISFSPLLFLLVSSCSPQLLVLYRQPTENTPKMNSLWLTY